MSTNCLIKRRIRAMLFLCAFIAFAFGCISINAKIKNDIPYAVLLQNGFLNISPQKAEQIKSNIDVQIEERGMLSAPLRSSEAVRVISTTSKAAYELEMLWGGFYQKNAVLEHRPYAVISDKLFARLFGGFGANEYIVVINESEYNLSGVYRSHQGFFADISSDGTEAVYVSRPLSAQSVPTRALLYGEESVFTLKDALSKEIQAPINAPIYDMRIAHQLSDAIINILTFLCASCLIYHALKKAYSIFMNCCIEIHSITSKCFVLHILQGVAITAIVCFAFFVLISQISIPPSLLPSDNIFDISHYKSLIIEFYQGISIANTYPSLNIAASFLWLQSAFASFSTILFYFFVSQIKSISILLQSGVKQ